MLSISHYTVTPFRRITGERPTILHKQNSLYPGMFGYEVELFLASKFAMRGFGLTAFVISGLLCISWALAHACLAGQENNLLLLFFLISGKRKWMSVIYTLKRTFSLSFSSYLSLLRFLSHHRIKKAIYFPTSKQKNHIIMRMSGKKPAHSSSSSSSQLSNNGLSERGGKMLFSGKLPGENSSDLCLIRYLSTLFFAPFIIIFIGGGKRISAIFPSVFLESFCAVFISSRQDEVEIVVLEERRGTTS